MKFWLLRLLLTRREIRRLWRSTSSGGQACTAGGVRVHCTWERPWTTACPDCGRMLRVTAVGRFPMHYVKEPK